MRLNNLSSIVLALALIMGLASCSTKSTFQSGSYKYLYDYESRTLHPDYVLYHFSDDSTTIYFRINNEELLYARPTSQSPFTAKLQISCKMSNESGSDTTSITITDPAKERNGWLIGSFNIKLPTGYWNMLLEFTDLTRGLTQAHYLSTDKSSRFSAHNYLYRFKSSNEPIFGNVTSTNKEIIIESARNSGLGRKPHVILMDNEGKLPPPPFSSNQPEIPAIGTDYYSLQNPDSLGRYILKTENKNYFITHDDNLKEGSLLRVTSVDFPAIKLAKSLEWPLRYITTKTEFDQISKSSYSKKLIDNFWVECGGNKNRAKDLIRIYYSRVEEANYYFSSYTDGWKTDRGMIHVVFGNPTKITKYSDREVWQYGEDNTTNQLVFVFHRLPSPLSSNVYQLSRDGGFKPYWERMVTVWRNGRIYND
jgi:GWxTD domain-containing protein